MKQDSPTADDLRDLLKQEQDATLPLIKDKFKNDLFSFNRNLLAAEDGKDKVKLSEFHREMCEFVTGGRKHKLILVPRGHLKSSLITVGRTLQILVNDPTARILIANATYEMSCTFIGEIQKQLRFNDDLISLYGDIAADPIRWNENMITLKSAKSHFGRKEPNVTAYGIGGNLVSQHYDYIIMDDIVNRDNTATIEQIEKTKNFFKDSIPLLDKGQILIVGTRWHDRDLYDWILDKKNGVIGEFDTFVRKAFEGSLDDENPSLLWPEKFSVKDLKSISAQVGPYNFSCQFQNNPVPDEMATFKKGWFRYYDPTDLKGMNMNVFMCVDPALSTEKEADYTAIVVLGVTSFDEWLILDIFRGKLNPDQLIGQIFAMNEQWHPLEVGIEDVAFQKVLQYQIQAEMKIRRKHIPIREIRPENRSKELRIRGLQPLYANGKVLHNKDLVYNEYLEDELMRFPFGKNDDTIDALAYMLDFAFQTRQRYQHRHAPSQSKEYLYAE